MQRQPNSLRTTDLQRMSELPLVQSDSRPRLSYDVGVEAYNPWIRLLYTSHVKFFGIVSQHSVQHQFNLLVEQSHSPLFSLRNLADIQVVGKLMLAWPKHLRYAALVHPIKILQGWSLKMNGQRNFTTDRYFELFIRMTKDMTVREVVTIAKFAHWLEEAMQVWYPWITEVRYYLARKQQIEISQAANGFVFSLFSSPVAPILPAELVVKIAELAALAYFSDQTDVFISQASATTAAQQGAESGFVKMHELAERRRATPRLFAVAAASETPAECVTPVPDGPPV